MPLSRSQVRATVEAYLVRHPDEREALGGLLSVLGGAAGPLSRGRLPDHVTCSAVVIDRHRRVLHIGPRAGGRLPAPGGHVADDRSLLAAALRGVREATGIPSEALCLTPQFLDTPIDIDAGPANGGLVHRHFDVRFAFCLTAEQPPAGAQWLPFADVRSATLRAKLLSAQGLDGRPEPVNASALIHDGHGRYLLHLRDDRDGIWEPWTLALLGGQREPGDGSLEATLRRELGEETPGMEIAGLAPFSVEKARSVDGLTVPVQVFTGWWNGNPDTVRLREGVLLRWFAPDTLDRLRLSPGLGELICRHAAEHPPSSSSSPAHDRLVPGEAPKGTEPHIVGVHLCLEDGQGQILLGLRHPDSAFAPDQWHLLAGHCEREEVISCLVREAREEAGLTIDPHEVELVHVLHLVDSPSARPRIGLFFRARAWSGTPTLREPDKCVQWRWWNPRDLPEDVVPYTRQAIAEILAGHPYSQRGWRTQDASTTTADRAEAGTGPPSPAAVDPAAARAAMVARLEETGALGPGPVRTALPARAADSPDHYRLRFEPDGGRRAGSACRRLYWRLPGPRPRG